MNSKQRAQEIGISMKEIISEALFPTQVWEASDEESLWFHAPLLFSEFEPMQLTFESNLGFECNAIQSFIFYHQKVPANKISQVDELIHALNEWLVIGHLYRDPAADKLVYTSGFIIRELGFSKAEFEIVLRALIANGREYLNFIRKKLKSNEDPKITLQNLFLKMSNDMSL